MRMVRKSRRYAPKIKLAVWTIMICTMIIYLYSCRIIPSLSESARSYLNIEINKEIERSISDYVSKNPELEFIDIRYSSDGKVSSMNANVNFINRTRTCVSKDILSSLNYGKIHSLKMPLGCLFGNELTYAKGPMLNFRFIASQNFISSIDGVFIENGINQTLHRLYIDFRIDVILSLPLKSINVPVNCRYLLSEVVIVGDVPDAYTDINRTFDDITESEIDDINDFGAET